MEYIDCVSTLDINKSKVHILTINKVKGIDCEYSIVFENHDEFRKFEHANKSVVGLGADIRFGKAKTSDKYLLKIGLKHEAAGYNKCVLVLKSNSWVSDNIDAIVERLRNQAANFARQAQLNQSGFKR